MQLNCASGTYSLSGAASCTSCPAGWACPSTTGVAVVACTPGQYSLANATACTDCPAGSACASTTSLPVACTSGFCSYTKATTCTRCPAGSYCTSTTAAPIACPSGFYSTGGATSCTPVPAGYGAVASTSSSLYSCDAGYYAPLRSNPAPSAPYSSLACTACPAGSSCNVTGASSSLRPIYAPSMVESFMIVPSSCQLPCPHISACDSSFAPRS